jgi:hypothetical protein
MTNGHQYKYSYKHAIDFINEASFNLTTLIKKSGSKTYKVYNIPCSFDIETTSIGTEKDKQAFMYIWMFGINGVCIYGRTWEQYQELINIVVEKLELGEDKRLICYSHNLGYEFQFMRKYFRWTSVFASSQRTPIYALTDNGIEYRCSYILTNEKLEDVGKHLKKYQVEKMVGDLDYNKIRTHVTPITTKELGYCINDIKVVMCHIQEEIERCGGITKIPLTKTGYVREYVRNECFKNRHRYQNLMRSLTITPDEYIKLKQAFQGGFTHANAEYSNLLMEFIKSYDLTSSYPTAMVAEKFPMSKGKIVKVENPEHFFRNLNTYCCLFTVMLKDVKLKEGVGDAPISKSKCTKAVGAIVDNGRIRKCEYLEMVCTEVDFQVYTKFYNFSFICEEMTIYEKGYLPKPIVMSILKFYWDKTTLKDVEGKEQEYAQSKSMINSIYGMIVMDIVRNEIYYNDDSGWDGIDADIAEQIEKYNSSKNRFLFYPWGVWVTAYARRNLFMGILECGNDYVYSDTDSVKMLNWENHVEFIIKYNENITLKLHKAMQFHGLNADSCEPKNPKGTVKPLGIWDDDGFYVKYKTLGAKRYLMLTKDGELKLTCAGVGKKEACKYLKETYENPFTAFANELYIPPEHTGKMTHTYIDQNYTGNVVDYMGNMAEVNQKSSIHLEKCEFTIGMSQEYMELLADIQTVERVL